MVLKCYIYDIENLIFYNEQFFNLLPLIKTKMKKLEKTIFSFFLEILNPIT